MKSDSIVSADSRSRKSSILKSIVIIEAIFLSVTLSGPSAFASADFGPGSDNFSTDDNGSASASYEADQEERSYEGYSGNTSNPNTDSLADSGYDVDSSNGYSGGSSGSNDNGGSSGGDDNGSGESSSTAGHETSDPVRPNYSVGVTGPASIAKEMVKELIDFNPGWFPDLINNISFEIEVVQLDLDELPSGEKIMRDPVTGETSAVSAQAVTDPYGNITGAKLSLPPEGVEFRAANGQTVSPLGMAAHETRHAQQYANGSFGMGTDLADRTEAENDAQRIENLVTGNDLEYWGNKRDPGSQFYAGSTPVVQGNESYQFFEQTLQFNFFGESPYHLESAILSSIVIF